MTPAKKAAAAPAPETPEVSEAEAPAAVVRNPWTLASNGPAPERLAHQAPPAEHGFRGQQADETPNEQYTVAGQLAAMPEKG